MGNFSSNAILGSTIVGSTDSEIIGIHHSDKLCVQLTWTNSTPAAGEFTANVTDICTKSAHGFTTGLKVRVSSTTTLPGGLSGSTDYFVIVGTVDTFALSDTLAHALAGTNIVNITDSGTGTHTITPTALAGGVVHLEGSNDKATWFDVASMTANITASGSAVWNVADAAYLYVRVNAIVTAGQVAIVGSVAQKGPSTR